MATLPKYLTQDELKRLFAAITSPRNRALFGVIYHYGLRVGEALMLTVDDVNFKNHRITIRRLKNGLGGEKPLWRHTAKRRCQLNPGVCTTSGECDIIAA
jgi:integrase